MYILVYQELEKLGGIPRYRMWNPAPTLSILQGTGQFFKISSSVHNFNSTCPQCQLCSTDFSLLYTESICI